MPNTITFKCAVCKETVTEPWNDQLAEAKFRHHFPDLVFDKVKLDLVCEFCYDKIRKNMGIRKTFQ